MVLISAALMLLCLGATAAWAAEAKIGVVDLQRALNECEAGKKAKAKLTERVEKMQTDLKAKKEAVDKLDGELKKQGAMLSADAKRDKERDLERQTRDLNNLARDYEEEYQQAQVAATQPIFKDLEQVIDKIGAEQGYTLIVESKVGGVIYMAKGVDITDEVVKAYNAKAKK